MRFAELFDEESVVCGLKSDDRDGCFQELLQSLVDSKRLTKKEADSAFEAIHERERVGSTGIGAGVAIPHVKLSGMRQLVVALGIHYKGIDFKAIDGEPVQIVFLIVRPADDGTEHLKFLQWISRLGRSGDFRRFMVKTNSRSEMVSLLREMSDI